MSQIKKKKSRNCKDDRRARAALLTVQIRYECGHRIMSVIDPCDYTAEEYRDEMSTRSNPIVRDHCACPTCKAAS